MGIACCRHGLFDAGTRSLQSLNQPTAQLFAEHQTSSPFTNEADDNVGQEGKTLPQDIQGNRECG